MDSTVCLYLECVSVESILRTFVTPSITLLLATPAAPPQNVKHVVAFPPPFRDSPLECALEYQTHIDFVLLPISTLPSISHGDHA